MKTGNLWNSLIKKSPYGIMTNAVLRNRGTWLSPKLEIIFLTKILFNDILTLDPLSQDSLHGALASCEGML
jgi:hypothetical protein